MLVKELKTILPYLILFYVVMFGCHLIDTCSFLMRDRQGMDPEGWRGGEDLGGKEGGEAITRI